MVDLGQKGEHICSPFYFSKTTPFKDSLQLRTSKKQRNFVT